ncbi:hypothetical protein [Chitinophaga costaii]|uniref:hypothetical protein n=1 Tax=Chitinophaga costaii TaxID=1335309 RepID=UPI000F4FE21A|nr:hypothetical protein [Chitinophaga costaii]
MAAVVWSLGFEWLFYFSLPFFAVLLFRIKTSIVVLILSGIILIGFLAIVFIFSTGGAFRKFAMFFGGIIAAYANRNERLREIVSSN